MLKRIDSLFSSCQILSRTEFSKIVKQKRVKVNGEILKTPSQKIDVEKDEVLLDDKKVEFNKYIYIMLNKPQGVVSSTDEKGATTVIDILPSEYRLKGVFPCGRLDKDTVGLVILTNDGISAHKRLSPKRHAKKVYYFETADQVSSKVVSEIENGVTLKDGYTTKPCQIKMITDSSGEITLIEGKYHEIKRIFGAKNNKITYLKRISFAGIQLDNDLKEGECRPLTSQEIKLFTE
ncbi:MAG: rRNA pseudouridine synthase [Clostridia bacterium]|nr:rRNA pseudouridine synthase [Clostridia bacterium]